MNRSAEQTNRTRTASRFTRFVCPALRFIPHEPRKKDTHSLNNEEIWNTGENYKDSKIILLGFSMCRRRQRRGRRVVQHQSRCELRILFVKVHIPN